MPTGSNLFTTMPGALTVPSAAEAGALAPGLLTFLKVAPTVSAQVLWAAPYPTIKEVEKNGSTDGLPPLPYFSMCANGYLWVAYGYTAGVDVTIMLPNFTGMLAGGYYSYKFLQFDSQQFNTAPYKYGTAAAFVGITGTVAMLDTAVAQQVLGYAGCSVVVAMFSGPLAVIKDVIDTKNTKSLPAPMAVATLVNCTLWASFGFLVIEDAFVYGPNVLGLASGITQCALLAKYGIYKEPVTQVAQEVPAEK